MTPSADMIDDLLWSAIGDPTRRRMLDLLLSQAGGTATTLSQQLPVTRQAVAKHLGVLDRAGLGPGRPDRSGAALPGGRGPTGPGSEPARLGRVGLGRPSATNRAARRGDPALAAPTHPHRTRLGLTTPRKKETQMADILHRIGVRTTTPADVYKALTSPRDVQISDWH